MNDLIILVADKNMKFTLRGALSRPHALGIRPVQCTFREHSERDGGVRMTGPELLALERIRFEHALLVMDFEGSGTRANEATALEAELDKRLYPTWGGNAKAIVIEPELDVWMWGSDNALKSVLGTAIEGTIRNWLREQGFDVTGADKPERPKEALEYLLRTLRRPRSSVIYERIAATISFKRCTDPAFLRLRKTLVRWFPA